MPAHLIPPPLEPEYESWLRAFWELSSERQIGFGLGSIPHSAIRNWADRAGYDEDESESFLGAMRVLDRVWLEQASSKSDSTTQQQPDRIVDQPLTGPLFDALFT